MITKEVRAAINRVLRQRLKEIGFVSAEILEKEDYAGDPILQIVIHYKKVGAEVDPSPTFSLARHIKDAIRPLGEERFPHFTHLFPEDQELKVA
jgi:hypothetical protein